MDLAFRTPSPLTEAYYAPANLDAVQRRLQRAIKAKGYAISRQSDVEVTGVMRGVFENYSTNDVSSDARVIRDEIKRLNQIVHEALVDQVMTGIEQYLGYVKDASTLPEPLSRGVNASIKGDRALELMPRTTQ